MEGTEKIRKVLFNEISLVISVIAVLGSFFLFVTGPDAKIKQDIAVMEERFSQITDDIDEIKTNHLEHIQESIDEMEGDILDIKLDMAEIKALLKK